MAAQIDKNSKDNAEETRLPDGAESTSANGGETSAESTANLPAIPFRDQDLMALVAAKRRLEQPSLTAQISDMVGSPIETLMRRLPQNMHERVDTVVQAALLSSLNLAVNSLQYEKTSSLAQRGHTDADGETELNRPPARDGFHKWLGAGTGAVGGVFGMWALSVELPVSTALILRSIADIARSEGHDLDSLEVRLSCLEVFALGGRSKRDNAAESGYWLVRAGLAKTIADAATYLARHGMSASGGPPLVRLVAAIASRFGSSVTAQAAVKALPLVSAVTGGAINVLFMNHFQEMAHGHFTVRRLEARYGRDAVEAKYKELKV